MPSHEIASERVRYASGQLTLGGFVSRPPGNGPFPAVIWNHGSGSNPEPRPSSGPAAFWVAQGFVFFEPHRRGYGLSAAGPDLQEVVDQVAKRAGAAAGDLLKMQMLATEQLDDQLAGLSWLRADPAVAPDAIVTMGVSLGGVQTLLAAEQETGLRAAVSFAGGAMNWPHNATMRARLLEAARHSRIPVMFVQAENDVDLGPSRELFAEMTRFGKSARLRIYPPYGGRTVLDGHTFGLRAPDLWGSDVAAFVREQLGA